MTVAVFAMDVMMATGESPGDAMAKRGENARVPAKRAKASPLTVKSAKEYLGPFLENHPYSEIAEIGGPDGKRTAIKKPWGDESIVIYVPNEIKQFSDVLNQIYLPERYTAIWHTDTKDFEIIYTAYPRPPDITEIFDRSFKFKFQQHEYKCEFGESSNRLLTLAENYQPVAASNTMHRNLHSFNLYIQKKSGEHIRGQLGEPTSFWIRNVDWDEDKITDLAKHLNFYMSYYDLISPDIIIHSPRIEKYKSPTRYRSGKFPENIIAREIDDNILHFWKACREGDPARRFLYCYRIIEYESVSYIESQARGEVRKFLSAPDALDDIQELTDEVVAAIQITTLHEEQKFSSLIKEVVSPKLLWREMLRNIDAFTSATEFDGGCCIESLAKDDWGEEDFKINGPMACAQAFRKIRNALSHGRDIRTGAVITPTAQNFEKLQPWVSLISIAAGEVIVYKDAL